MSNQVNQTWLNEFVVWRVYRLISLQCIKIDHLRLKTISQAWQNLKRDCLVSFAVTQCRRAIQPLYSTGILRRRRRQTMTAGRHSGVNWKRQDLSFRKLLCRSSWPSASLVTLSLWRYWPDLGWSRRPTDTWPLWPCMTFSISSFTQLCPWLSPWPCPWLCPWLYLWHLSHRCLCLFFDLDFVLDWLCLRPSLSRLRVYNVLESLHVDQTQSDLPALPRRTGTTSDGHVQQHGSLVDVDIYRGTIHRSSSPHERQGELMH